MNLSRQQAELIIQTLKEIVFNNRYADKALEASFKKEKSIDGGTKQFVADATYDIIRKLRYLQALCNSDSLWRLLGTWALISKIKLPDWKEFSSIDSSIIQQRKLALKDNRAVRESIPDWLEELGVEELGDRWEVELKALNQRPKTYIRVNTLKANSQALIDELGAEGIKVEQLTESSTTLRVSGIKNLFQTEAFTHGKFEMQDAGSQRVAEFLQVKSGMRVVDACCGAGGKTLHLAALMNNKGRLIALDISSKKLEELKKRAKRAGVDNLEIKQIESAKTLKRLAETADRLLLDVPCSGLGVLKRNPDAKWSLKKDYIERLKQLQQSILDDYCNITKKGGELVYATCSILPSENENQIEKFLAKHATQFELIEEKHIYPSQGFDGFYMARLRRLS